MGGGKQFTFLYTQIVSFSCSFCIAVSGMNAAIVVVVIIAVIDANAVIVVIVVTKNETMLFDEFVWVGSEKQLSSSRLRVWV